MLKNILKDSVFLRKAFDLLPSGVLVLDDQRRICQLSNFIEKTFNTTSEDVVGKISGDSLVCLGRFGEDPKNQCGKGNNCHRCVIQKAGTVALTDNKKFRGKGIFNFMLNGRECKMSISVNSMPLLHKGRRYTVIFVANHDKVSEINAVRAAEKEFQNNHIIGEHPRVREVISLLAETAHTDLPVLLLGESGTGKELAALSIHQNSPRKNKPFVPINCSALPHDLLESELFGHVKGAFTGAISDKKGRFEMAQGGTVFLDEIGDIEPAVQVKLLRFLQEKTFEKIGETKTIKVDVRIISATNKLLDEEVKAGRFRLDLYYRLCVVPVSMPPLREKIEDVALLANHFIAKFDIHSGREKRSLSEEALQTLQAYSWPGNVRELQNVIQFSLMKCQGSQIVSSDFPAHITERSGPELFHTRQKKKPVRTKLDSGQVLEALRKTKGNKLAAARELGVSRATLYRFIHKDTSSQVLWFPKKVPSRN
ncbi:MAG: sigma 54-interacting transcriptional regulator [Desulfobulbaceae bacterium]|nr:sigma 54-interacting transcriptional regulator [Desulfobulbaceae bacterium]